MQSRDEKGLHALSQEIPKLRKIIVCNERRYRKTDTGVEIYPLDIFLKQLWDEGFLVGYSLSRELLSLNLYKSIRALILT